MHKNKKGLKIFLTMATFVIVLCFLFVSLSTDLKLVLAVYKENDFLESDIEAIADKNFFGKCIKANVQLETGKEGTGKVTLKLFDIFKIQKKEVNIVRNEHVHIGGDLVAMTIKPHGLIVSKVSTIKTSKGDKTAFEIGKIKEGDIILKIDDTETLNYEDIKKAVDNSQSETVSIEILRGGEKLVVNAKPQMSLAFGDKRLGIFVRDDFGGIGTLTFIKENGDFGALGHSVSINSNIPEVFNGQLTKAIFVGAQKAGKNKAGEIKAYENFSQSANLGTISKNTKIGVFGKISNEEFKKSFQKLEVGGRFGVKPGKAQILAKVNDGEPEFYDIKILKTSKQQKSDSRGLVIKITDKKLLSQTGGIIQGMSGSPIVQDGRIVGAVTHVFLNDARKGYGVYLDFMMEK